MSKKILWLVMSGLMVLSLVMAACGPAATPTTPTTPSTPTAPTTPTTPAKPGEEPTQKEAIKPTAEVPKYGGTLNLFYATDITSFDVYTGPTGGPTKDLTLQRLWSGDWTKGPAGGYGTNETDWGSNYDIWDHKIGFVAESTKWTVDSAKDHGTIVYTIRQGIHYGLNPNSEASRLVGGRELTADDVIAHLKRMITDPGSTFVRSNPELKTAEITKTGPWEVTVKLPLSALVTGIFRFGDATSIQPPEVVAKYGNMENWKTSVGTGPFILTDYIAGSAAILVKNSNFWGRDPIGPGKGNQLPYMDEVRFLIIPDISTQQAALRTGKLDQMPGLSWEDAALMRKTAPELKEAELPVSAGRNTPRYISPRTDKPPFNDVRVRRAMMMATDFDSIQQNLFGGLGQILTWPFEKVKGYEALYLGLDDPEMTASVKELYIYNPDKAKQLLKEAGYPNGFKTSALITAPFVDYYSIIKDMWAKVGIEVTLDVRDTGAKTTIINKGEHEGLSDGGRGPVSIFYSAPQMVGTAGGSTNMSHIDDPVINEAMEKIREAAMRDMNEAMKLMKELMKHVLDQAYAIPGPYVPTYVFWWPWVKNYSGEQDVGYFNTSWPQWVWLDQDLKKSMGY